MWIGLNALKKSKRIRRIQMATAKVDWWDGTKGIGEAVTDNGERIFLNTNYYRATTRDFWPSKGKRVLCVVAPNEYGGLYAKQWSEAPDDVVSSLIIDVKKYFGSIDGGPVEGEWFINAHGERKRITSIEGKSFQPCTGSFFVYSPKSLSFSGGLDSPVSLADLEFTGKYMEAGFWVFRNMEAKDHNGIDFTAEVRVWRINE
jgi:cold shock CspA family protein